jgi:hypothetical protein
LNGLLNRVLDRDGRSASELDKFIDVVFHGRFFGYSHRGNCIVNVGFISR